MLLPDHATYKIGDLLRSPNELMVLSDNFLNHDLTDPFKFVEKALHITSFEPPKASSGFYMNLGGPLDLFCLRIL